MLFRYWNSTTCIMNDNLPLVEQNITKLLEEEEEWKKINLLPKIDYAVDDLRNKPWDKLTNLSLIALFKTESGWTIIKTFPERLFCRRSSNNNRLRLSFLAQLLNCNAFYLEASHQDREFLLEANAKGDTFLTGCQGMESPEYFQLYEEEVDLFSSLDKLSLIDVSPTLQLAMKVNESPELKKLDAEANRLMKKQQSWEYEEFTLIEEASKSHTERIDRALAETICKSNSFWYITNLTYLIYNNSDILKQDNIKLLYFHSPNSYKGSATSKIFSLPFSKSEDAEDAF
jgi:hypothetical protein